MSFPHESIPDGSVLLPHHFTYGALFALLFCAVVWDNYAGREPIGVAFGLLTSLFAFLFVWPRYPVVGATLTLVGLGIATVCILFRSLWSAYPLRWRVATFLCILIAWDDAIEHSFPITTPLDWIWHVFIYPHMM